MKSITCFIIRGADAEATRDNLLQCPLVGEVRIVGSLKSSTDIRMAAEAADTEFTLFYTKTFRLDWVHCKRKPEFPVVIRKSRCNSRKTTWFPRHRKMRPLPATASQ